MKNILGNDKIHYDHGSLTNQDIYGAHPKRINYMLKPTQNNPYQIRDNYGHYFHPYQKMDPDAFENHQKHHPDTQNNLFGCWRKELQNNNALQYKFF